MVLQPFALALAKPSRSSLPPRRHQYRAGCKISNWDGQSYWAVAISSANI